MDPTDRRDVVCPCCQSSLTVDVKTGEVLWHHPAPKEPVSLAQMVQELETKKRQTEERFEREKTAMKDRQRLLEEKVREAMKHVDPSEKPPPRPIDLD